MIAIYDDDQCTVDVIKAVLESHDFRNIQTYTIEDEILKELESGHVGLIITDMTGHDVVLNPIRMLGVVHITMSGDKNNKPHLDKPFDMAHLIRLVKERLCSA